MKGLRWFRRWGPPVSLLASCRGTGKGGVLQRSRTEQVLLSAVIAVLAVGIPSARADLTLGPEGLVRAGGAGIDVPDYSVPSFIHWDDDGLMDLVVGEGSGTYVGKIRVYLNTGTHAQPQFSAYSYVQSDGVDLELPGSG